jgi:hypothetical protein
MGYFIPFPPIEIVSVLFHDSTLNKRNCKAPIFIRKIEEAIRPDSAGQKDFKIVFHTSLKSEVCLPNCD